MGRRASGYRTFSPSDRNRRYQAPMVLKEPWEPFFLQRRGDFANHQRPTTTNALIYFQELLFYYCEIMKEASETITQGLGRYSIGEKLRTLRLRKSMGLVELSKHTGL